MEWAERKVLRALHNIPFKMKVPGEGGRTNIILDF